MAYDNEKNKKVGIHFNVNEVSWFIWVVIGGGAFSIFSLIHNDKYIYYGFITIIYGIIAHLISRFFDNHLKKTLIGYIFQFFLIVIWLAFGYHLYYISNLH